MSVERHYSEMDFRTHYYCIGVKKKNEYLCQI